MQGGILIRLANQLVTQLEQRVAVGAAARHQLKGKAIALAQAVHRRWRHGKDGRIADGAQLLRGAQGNGLSGVFIPLTFGPVFQGDKRHPGVLAAAAKAEALNGEDNVGVGFLFGEEPLAHLAADFGSTDRRRACWQGVLHHDFALVFRRQEAARQFQHREPHRAAEQGVDDQHAAGTAQGAQHLVLIAMLGLAVEAVKRAEKALLMWGGVAQNRAAQRRRQG